MAAHLSGETGGEARLCFARRGMSTVLADRYTRAPLHVSVPLTASVQGEARVLLLASGGGLLAGENQRITIQCDTGARAWVGAVGATRLLPSAKTCRQETMLCLEPDSSLVYFPEALIPCAEAIYDQQTTVHLGAGATAMIGEIVTPGRLAHGERFAYQRLVLGLRVLRAGRPVLVERVLLEPASGHLPVLLGAYTHLANLALLGPPATADLAAQLHDLCGAHGIAGGATLAAEGVLVVRALGSSTHELRTLLHAAIERALASANRAHSVPLYQGNHLFAPPTQKYSTQDG